MRGLRWKRRGGRMAVGAVVALALVLGLAACGGDPAGPGEDALLPAAALVYPGGAVEDRDFFEASDQQGEHGQDLSNDAALDVHVTLDQPTSGAAIQDWYIEQLEADGWRTGFHEPGNSTRWYQEADGIRHQYIVQVSEGNAQGDSIEYTVRYSMTFGD